MKLASCFGAVRLRMATLALVWIIKLKTSFDLPIVLEASAKPLAEFHV